MQQTNLKLKLVKPLFLLVSFLTIYSFAAKAGQDYYEIYLNKTLLVKHYAGDFSAALVNLPLDDAKETDQVSIYFFHCDIKGAGKGRTIVARNEQNKILKEWKFADPSDPGEPMTISVKDLLALKKANHNSGLHLYYTSSQHLPKGLTLASINQVDKKVTKVEQGRFPIFSAGLLGLIILMPVLRG